MLLRLCDERIKIRNIDQVYGESNGDDALNS
jgi:hypothetical protein